MTEIKPATDEQIAAHEKASKLGWAPSPLSALSLIARIRQADTWHGYIRDALGLSDNEPMRFDYYAEKIEALRENTIRECAEVIEVWAAENTSDGSSRNELSAHLVELVLSKRSQP